MPQREFAVQNISLSFGHFSMRTTDEGMDHHHHYHHDDDDDGVILLVGRSGSGKSTLLRLLSGMECPNNNNDDDYNYGGCIVVNGRTIISGGRIDAIQNNTMSSRKKKTEILIATSNNNRRRMPGIPSWVKMGILSPVAPLLHDDDDSREKVFGFVQPVILVGKPDFDDTLSVMERIVQMGEDAVRRLEKYAGWWKQPTTHESTRSVSIPNNDDAAILSVTMMLQLLAKDITSLLTLTPMQVSCRPSELSPSGEYLFGIACGCMMSMAPSVVLAASSNISTSECDDENENYGVIAYYPILLLDELFDTEHPSIVESCSRGMLNLVRAGGVIVSATHRPAHFRGMSARTITLSKFLRYFEDASVNLYFFVYGTQLLISFLAGGGKVLGRIGET